MRLTVINFLTADSAESKEHALTRDTAACVTVRRRALLLRKEFQRISQFQNGLVLCY